MSVAIDARLEGSAAAVGTCPRGGAPLDGPRLVRATNAFVEERASRSAWLLAQTVVLVVALHFAILFSPMWAKPLLSLGCGLLYVRLFIFYHDYLHGAQLRRSKFVAAVMHGVGMLILATTSVWRESHDYHHRNNARVIGSGIGSYPVVTVRMWRRMDPKQRRAYRALRNPLTMIFGYFTVFMIGMSFSPFRRDPSSHWMAPVAVLLHAAAIAAMWFFFGFWQAVFSVILPVFLATALGSYLFFAQHNFPGVKYFERREWTFDQAALRSSSMFEMPGWLHWMTGNIGFHHIHHLNHRIPFYRLPEAYAAVPELQQPGRTSWRPSDIRACLELAVWDPAQGRMITYAELRALAPETFASSKSSGDAAPPTP